MSALGQSVFLSYAREDLAAARRLADALSAFEVEVWFDEGGLEGGDAWDQKIRRQIKGCSLFIPIISAQTQARREAYFRLEWKLAEERTHLMAEGTAFLLPIAIDDLPEAGALVPESFRHVQWIRLPRGVPNTQLVERVRALLEAQRSAPAAPPLPRVERPAPVRRWFRGWWLAGEALLVVALLAVAFWPKPVPAPALKPPAESPAPAPRPKEDKSIAVLPFINMSDDKDSGYFADGVHEDLLTHLAKIAALKVISRTSVMQYRDTKKNISQIGHELGVAYVLEGSVRRMGNKVRVTGQLIRAASDDHLWAQSYDGDLSDIFALQTQLATKIADELQAVLTPQEKRLIAVRPTANPEAYSLYLQARALRRGKGISSKEVLVPIQALLERAVQLDPEFVPGWTELSHSHITQFFNQDDDAAGQLQAAKTALDRASALAPEAPEVQLALGEYYYYGYRDYARATQYYQQALALMPGSGEVHWALGLVARRQGLWRDSLEHLRRGHELDPRNSEISMSLATLCENGRYFEEGWTTFGALRVINPENWELAGEEAVSRALFSGPPAIAEDWFNALSLEARRSRDVRNLEGRWAWTRGDAHRFLRVDESSPSDKEDSWIATTMLGIALNEIGEKERARMILEQHANYLQGVIAGNSPRPEILGALGLTYMALGRDPEAIAAADRAVSLLPETVDRVNGPNIARMRAVVLAGTGHKAEALREVARLVRTPFGIQVEELATALDWTPLHGDPQFEAIVRDPANRAPKF